MTLATQDNQTTRPFVEFCSQPDWLSLPVATRNELRKIFSIGKSGQVQVTQAPGPRGTVRDRVTSDGTQPEDLMRSFNVVEALKYLGQEFNPKHQYDFTKILPLVLKKAGLIGTEEVSAGPAPTSRSEQRRKEIQDSKNALTGVPKDSIPPPGIVKKQPKPGANKVKISQKKK